MKNWTLAVILSTAVISPLMGCGIASAATIEKRSALNFWLIDDAFANVSATFDFIAHPSDKEKVNGVVKNGQAPYLSRSFTDTHGTVGQGIATFDLKKDGAFNGVQKYLLTEQAISSIIPSCPKTAKDCGPVSMTTTTERSVTISEIVPELLPDKSFKVSPSGASSIESIEGSLDVFLGQGTSLSLGETGAMGESILIGGTINPLYNINLSVVKDSLTGLQKLNAEFSQGIDNSNVSFSFDTDNATIVNRVINAFTYDSISNTWTVDNDNSLFSALVKSNQEFDLVGKVSGDSPAVEQPVPEPSSILGFLALGTLGVGATLKRKLKSSKSTEKETTKVS